MHSTLQYHAARTCTALAYFLAVFSFQARSLENSLASHCRGFEAACLCAGKRQVHNVRVSWAGGQLTVANAACPAARPASHATVQTSACSSQ